MKMSVKEAKTGLVISLLIFSVARSENKWEVTYSDDFICAVDGSTVEIHAIYSFPTAEDEMLTVVKKGLWFTRMRGGEPADLQREAEFAGRVMYRSFENQHTLTIKDVRDSDSAKFRLMISQSDGEAIGSPGVTLKVTALQVKVTTSRPVLYPRWLTVECRSSCHFPSNRFVWKKNGEKITEEQSKFSRYFSDADRVSCAVEGYEKFPSPSVCVQQPGCNRVTYTRRSICALSLQSVDISCTYSSKDYIVSSFWLKLNSGLQEVVGDPDYAGRVEVLQPVRGKSILKISGLKESDSAEYYFSFQTKSFKWTNDLPGTTLTVTALRVEVTRIIKVHQSHTEAELRCRSSCSPSGRLSYVWFKNGLKNLTQQTSTYTDSFRPRDVVSCMFEGHEDHRSPPVYPSKLPALFLSPPGEIVEGSSFNLTCRVDGDPLATTTLNKGNDVLLLSPAGIYNFLSIGSEDRGLYRCTSEDQYSVSLFVDVQYAPKLPLVSVNFSGWVVDGSSVTLVCRSDANPAANYSWFRDDEEAPKAQEETFTISNLQPEHSGGYYCEAQNSRGRRRSGVYRLAVTGLWKLLVALSTSVVCLGSVLILLIVYLRRERSSKQKFPEVRNQQADDLTYASIQLGTVQADPIYSNFNPTELHRHDEESVTYSTLKCSGATSASCEDGAALYGNVNKSFCE